MGEKERAEVKHLEEELNQLFESRRHRDLHDGLAAPARREPADAWVRLAALSAKTSRPSRPAQTFDQVLSVIESLLKGMPSSAALSNALSNLAQAAASVAARSLGTHEAQTVSELETRLRRLEHRVEQLGRGTASLIVPITTVAPEPYEILRPIHVVIHASEEEYVASFFDANVYASGDTEEEALRNLASRILDAFDTLSEEPYDTLGPEPQRQLAVLREFVTRRAPDAC